MADVPLPPAGEEIDFDLFGPGPGQDGQAASFVGPQQPSAAAGSSQQAYVTPQVPQVHVGLDPGFSKCSWA